MMADTPGIDFGGFAVFHVETDVSWFADLSQVPSQRYLEMTLKADVAPLEPVASASVSLGGSRTIVPVSISQREVIPERVLEANPNCLRDLALNLMLRLLRHEAEEWLAVDGERRSPHTEPKEST